MKTIELRTINGIRNDVSPERFDRDADGKRTGKVDLVDAVNVDLDETGKILRRLGVTQIVGGAWHSLFAAGDSTYAVVNSVLSHISPSFAITPITAVSGRVAYRKIIDTVYWSDNAQCGALKGAANVPWGIAVPGLPTPTAIAGNMRPGRYLFTMTYVRSTGEESGAPKSGEAVLTANQGIALTGAPVSLDPLVTSKRIYLTPCNGELPCAVATLSNSVLSASFTETPVYGMELRTQHMAPPLPGKVVGYFAGCSYIAYGRYLLYSQPHEYGLFDRRSGFVGFPSDVRVFAPVSDGVFIGTETETYWCAGTDPTKWQLERKATYGGVLGTEYEVRHDLVGAGGLPGGNVAAWMGKKGLCLGYDGGQLQEATGGRYWPPVANEGASLLKFRGGTPQIVTTLFS